MFLTACVSQQALPPVKKPLPSLSPTFVASSSPTQVLTITHTPSLPVCEARTGSLEQSVIDTDMLYKPMRFIVYLPPCYSFNNPERYPVLYLLHGQGFTEEQWIRVGAVETADRLISSGETPPFIIVFPFDYSNKQPTEYKYEDVFIQFLIPEIDKNYRTFPVAAQRAIGGLSRGGAWALRIGARHPQLFGSIGGHSPAIFYVDQKSLQRNLLAMPESQLPRIWLDVGDSDSEYEVIVPFEEFLSKNNISHEWHKYIGWHDEKYWAAHVERYLKWYAQDWR